MRSPTTHRRPITFAAVRPGSGWEGRGADDRRRPSAASGARTLGCAALLLAGGAVACVSAQSTPPRQDLIRAQQDRSWISPGRVLKWWTHGVNFAPSDVDSLLFEASISPNFTLWGADNVRFVSAVKAIVLTPRVSLRMHTAPSEPVRSPSFNPFVTFYSSIPFRDEDTDFLVWRLAHHSNGQEGPAILPDGSANLVDGSFSTNYVELGPSLSRIHQGSYVFFRPTVQWHFGQDELAKEFYGQWRANLRVLRLTNRTEALRGLYDQAHLVLQADLGYHPDRTWLSQARRLDFSLAAALLSPFGGTMGPFAQLYVGRDYYNLRYRTKHMWTLRFGFSTSGGSYEIY